MSWLKRLFNKEEPMDKKKQLASATIRPIDARRSADGEPELTRQSSEQSFFFVCSGNASLIDAYDGLFKVVALSHIGAAGHYYASKHSLDVRREEASKASLPFVGQCYMGAESTPVSHMHEVLLTLSVAASRDIHIAFVSVDQTRVSWVQKVYRKLLSQAVSQGILPYRMYVTKDKDASQFLLGSFNKIP